MFKKQNMREPQMPLSSLNRSSDNEPHEMQNIEAPKETILYTAPIRRKKSLGKGCGWVIILFSPTLLVSILFVYIYFQREYMTVPDSPTREPSTASVKMEPSSLQKSFLNQQHFLYPHLILDFSEKGEERLLILVLSEKWKNLSCTTKKRLVQLWLQQWQDLGGVQIRILNQNHQVLATGYAHNQTVQILDCE